MSTAVLTRTYAKLPFCEREIWRYAGCREADGELRTLLSDTLALTEPCLQYRVAYRVLPLRVEGDISELSCIRLSSHGLAKNLQGCTQAVLFAATVGVGIDRLIARYGRLSPTRALLLQAIGAAQIEELCDAFCADIAKEADRFSRPRFSPGYGDLPLTAQREIFSVLDCERRIGLTLNDSLLMSPSKSVTAVMGLCEEQTAAINHSCTACAMQDCAFRRRS